MLDFLKNHPFSVETFFNRSIVISYAISKEELEPLLPECLTLDTFQDKWGFIALAMVQTKDLRPKGFPKFMGNDFFLIGYRVFVKYIDRRGKRLRGLYILRSETNRQKMSFFGNVFTHYNYRTTDIDFKVKESTIRINSIRSALDIEVEAAYRDIPLPEQSPFSSWKEARRFAGPLPFTFTYNEPRKEVLIIEGVRQNWKPKPIYIKKQTAGFIKDKAFEKIQLANGFLVSDIPYYWKKGRIEKWNP